MVKNKINGKVYIGQSVNIEERWRKHKGLYDFNSVSLLRLAMKKYKVENFEFIVLEECDASDLNKRERYFIEKYKADKEGYNILPGGESKFGENNPNAKLNEEDVLFIRKIYNSQPDLTKREIYEDFFSSKVGWRGFEKVWSGETWRHIGMDVYTKENKEYYKNQAKVRRGQKNGFSNFSDKEVIQIRDRYVTETGAEIYKDYSDRITYSGFERVLHGKTYSHLPIYKKRSKTWI